MSSRAVALAWIVVAACGSGAEPPAPAPAPPEPAPAREPAPEPAPTAPTFTGVRIRLTRVERDGIVVPAPIVCLPAISSEDRLGDPTSPHGVLYALDGDALVDQLGLCAHVEALARAGVIEPWIVVGVPSTEARESVLAGRPADLAAILADVIEPELAARAVIGEGNTNRALIGFSYGGLAAIQMALARPQHFGRVLALSPSLWYADRSTLAQVRRSETQLPVRLYVDAGTLEGDRGEPIPYMIADVRDLVAAVRARGMIFGRDVALREVAGQGHSMDLAATRLPGALAFALGGIDLRGTPPRTLAIAAYDPVGPAAPRTFSLTASYDHDVVVSWPPELADVRCAGAPVRSPRLPPGPLGAMQAALNGVSAERSADPP